MILVQKRFSNKATYEFRDETLKYTLEDKSAAGDLVIDYADFPQESSMRVEKNGWLRNVELIWVALGVFQLGTAIIGQSSLSGKGFWLLLGLLCLAIYKIAITKYSVFSLEHGTIYIIRDKKHDEIIHAINKRRKAQLFKWYGEINPDNEAQNEIEKFRWLQKQNVLSKEEAENKIAQIELIHKEINEQTGKRQLN